MTASALLDVLAVALALAVWYRLDRQLRAPRHAPSDGDWHVTLTSEGPMRCPFCAGHVDGGVPHRCEKLRGERHWHPAPPPPDPRETVH